MIVYDPEEYKQLLKTHIHPKELLPYLHQLLSHTPNSTNIYIQLALSIDNLEFQIQQEEFLSNLYDQYLQSNDEELLRQFTHHKQMCQDLLDTYTPPQEKQSFELLIQDFSNQEKIIKDLFKEI